MTSTRNLGGTHLVTERTGSGKFLRTVWRTHFYAAIIAAPILIILTLSGLVILYTDPIQGALDRHLTRVPAVSAAVSLERQRAAADLAAPPGAQLVIVTPSKAPDRSTLFEYAAGNATYIDVYVNPHTGEVLGTKTAGDDVVGLANRLHGFLNNDALQVPLVSPMHLLDRSKRWVVQIPVGDVLIETAAVWALVLALSGIYLWWPRRSQKGKALLRPRRGKRGRLRWRDIHASSGIVVSGVLIVFVVTGMSWSSYWGAWWSTASNTITASQYVEAPTSTMVTAGQLDRFGHRISWATREDEVPSSPQPPHRHQGGIHGRSSDGTASGSETRVGLIFTLDDIAEAARDEELKPGWSVSMPVDSRADDGTTIYGSYQLSNAWPARLKDEQTIYLDQFTGKTLARSGPDSYGTLAKATEFGVLTHMGTQYGLATRIVMTLGCVLLLVSVLSSTAMWWIRRPTGRLGLPKRPARPSLPKMLGAIALAVGIVYPLWAVSVVLIMFVDQLLIRRIPRIRSTFGMPAKG